MTLLSTPWCVLCLHLGKHTEAVWKVLPVGWLCRYHAHRYEERM